MRWPEGSGVFNNFFFLPISPNILLVKMLTDVGNVSVFRPGEVGDLLVVLHDA